MSVHVSERGANLWSNKNVFYSQRVYAKLFFLFF